MVFQVFQERNGSCCYCCFCSFSSGWRAHGRYEYLSKEHYCYYYIGPGNYSYWDSPSKVDCINVSGCSINETLLVCSFCLKGYQSPFRKKSRQPINDYC